MSKDKTINYIHFETIDSTNTWAKNHASILDPHKITCITAKEQTAGRGRFKNQWLSFPEKSLCATLYFCVPKNSSYIQNLAQLLSISCCKSLTHFGFTPKIKWPNDILLNEKKVAGILCEITQVEELSGVVLGIGLNVNVDQTNIEQINQPATSLFLISKKEWNLEKVLQNLLSYFLEDLSTLESKGFQALHSYYEEHLAFKGMPITVKNGDKQVSGICDSISPLGSLFLKTKEDQKIEIATGVILNS